MSPVVTQIYPEALSIFRDAYTVEFLGLPPVHPEADLHRGLLNKLKEFLIERGRDFCFVDSEFPLQVGWRSNRQAYEPEEGSSPVIGAEPSADQRLCT